MKTAELKQKQPLLEKESPKSLIISTSAYVVRVHSLFLCTSKSVHSQPRTGLWRDDKAPQPIKQKYMANWLVLRSIQDERKRILPFLLKGSALCSFFPLFLSLSWDGWSSSFYLSYFRTSEPVNSLATAMLFFTTGTHGSSQQSVVRRHYQSSMGSYHQCKNLTLISKSICFLDQTDIFQKSY